MTTSRDEADFAPNWDTISDYAQDHNATKASDTMSTVSRAEQKALDRGIPWREIDNKPVNVVLKYQDAIHKESAKWAKYAPTRVLNPKEAAQVYRDDRLRRRILKARAAYPGKNCGVGELFAKCRMVLIGCGEPDLEHLQWNTPTPTRASFFFVVQVYASSSRNTKTCWHLATGDVEAAFLQGAREEHSLPLYMAGPRDPLLEATGVWQEFELAESTSNMYAKANAPWCWLQEVIRRMRRLGFKSTRSTCSASCTTTPTPRWTPSSHSMSMAHCPLGSRRSTSSRFAPRSPGALGQRHLPN